MMPCPVKECKRTTGKSRSNLTPVFGTLDKLPDRPRSYQIAWQFLWVQQPNAYLECCNCDDLGIR